MPEKIVTLEESFTDVVLSQLAGQNWNNDELARSTGEVEGSAKQSDFAVDGGVHRSFRLPLLDIFLSHIVG